MSPLEYLIWSIAGGLFTVAFGFVLVRAVTTAYYRSRIDYDRLREDDRREDRAAEKSSDCYK